jgi:ATP-dependent Zn protease
VTQLPSRVATAWHEAGHAAAAVVLGLGVERSTIIPEGDCLGHVIVPVANDPDLAYYVDRAVMSWCGPLAEQRHFGGGVDELGGEDRDQIRAYGELAALGLYEADTFTQWTRARAMNLLAAHFPAVAAVALALLERDTLSCAEVRQLVTDVEHQADVVPIRSTRPELAIAARTSPDVRRSF